VITKPNQEAFQGINLFNGGIGGSTHKKLVAGNLLTTSLKGMISGVYIW
jgi:hypothetical protein